MVRFGRGYQIAHLFTPPVPPVVFQSKGTGAFDNSGSVSETHVIGSGASYLLTGFVTGGDVNTVRCGSTPMTQYATATDGRGVEVYVYYLVNPPAGSQTIAATITGGFGGVAFNMIQSAVFVNVASLGAPVSTSGNGTSWTVTTPSQAGQILFNVFGSVSGSTPPNSYSGTSLYTTGQANVIPPTQFGYAYGTGGNVTLSATAPDGGSWAGLVVPINPR